MYRFRARTKRKDSSWLWKYFKYQQIRAPPISQIHYQHLKYPSDGHKGRRYCRAISRSVVQSLIVPAWNPVPTRFAEPLSPTTSTDAPKTAPTSSSSAKPSITGILKNAMKAPPAEERETSTAEAAIQSIGDDGQKKGQ